MAIRRDAWRRDRLYVLSEAARTDSLIEARCPGCSPDRWYHPEDLIALYGDIPAGNLELKMRCGRCGNGLHVSVKPMTAGDRQRIKLRRLDRVWWVRRASWRVEDLG